MTGNEAARRNHGADTPARPVHVPAPPPRIAAIPLPASASRVRPRHRFLFLSFVLIVVLPVVGAGYYLYARAADQYASHVGFSVRTEEKSAAIEILGGITELSGSSSSDTDILFAYLTSQELVRKVDERVDLRAIWSRVSPSQDPVHAYRTPGTIEDLMGQWEKMITIIHDSGSGMIDLRILAFDPLDAQRIAEALLDESSRMINRISALAREDAIGYARDELDVALQRLRMARQALTTFRNRTQIVDPGIDTQNQMGLLVTLQQQLAGALIELDLLTETTRESDPRVAQARRRVAVIEGRIAAERHKLGLGAGGRERSDVFANLVGEYEGLIVDREFAESAYTAALATFDAAQADARRQSRYLAAHVRPTLAERSDYPERGKILSLILLFLLFSWAIAGLVYYSVRDRS
ncbi:capsular polysaccharide transport system permease protein [Roseovarius azorensis]|uniref:Capsular polysaccharide transport system permease protein n=1 Tax=Roseovarius azorensis TaxID=1287727 RepID=A0A1H7PZI8_9RHOB|nr:capsule biosynthesis protein [Roseovarius azorensis]SEL40457.1 capsular polysaccharide transport system permease protein [Roseovarius azorensis]